MHLAPALERLVQSDLVDRSIATERIMATLGGLFGMLALIVSSRGIFAVTAFQLSRRINEPARTMLFGIAPTAPGISVLTMILGVTAFAAGWLPALSAWRVDPMIALRHQ
jgi:ABC-type antimicrobial peptide transport system permease subunit